MNEVKTVTKTTLEELAELDERRNELLGKLRVERAEAQKVLEAIQEKLGPERMTRRKRVAKVEGGEKAPRKKKGGLGAGLPDVQG